MSHKISTGSSKTRKQKSTPIAAGDATPGAGGEWHQIVGGAHPALTTNQGVAIADNQNSLKANPQGPTLLEDFVLREKITHFNGFHSAAVGEAGGKGRIRAESFADHYPQARQFYLSQTAHEQAHIASALVFEFSKVEHVHVREAMVGHLRHIEEDLATRVAAAKTRQWDREATVRTLA